MFCGAGGSTTLQSRTAGRSQCNCGTERRLGSANILQSRTAGRSQCNSIFLQFPTHGPSLCNWPEAFPTVSDLQLAVPYSRASLVQPRIQQSCQHPDSTCSPVQPGEFIATAPPALIQRASA